MDAVFTNALVAVQQYHSDLFDPMLSLRLENALEALTSGVAQWSRSIVCESQVESNPVLLRLLGQLRSILPDNHCSPQVLSAVFSFLTELAWFSPVLRKYLQRNLQYEVPLCLSALEVKRNKLDDAVWISCLKLIQLFTYDCPLRWHPVAMDLVKLMVQEVCCCCQNAKANSLPHCLGILLNYCRQLPDAIQFIKLQENIQTFNRTLLQVLKEASASVVILSSYFVILAFQDIRDNNFSAGMTLIKTFKCITNVIGRGQSYMSRLYAVDLFVRLIQERTVRRQLFSSSHFNQILSELCALFDSLSDHLEQVVKIYELFLLSCQVEGVRQALCGALLAAGPTNSQRLTSPLLAVLQMARASCDSLGGFVELPVQAIRVLQLALEHTIDRQERIADYLAPDSLLQFLEDSLKITLETGHPLVREKSLVVCEALSLATLLCRDASVRADVAETVDPVLCAHLAHFQLLSNPIGSCQMDATDLPQWSIIGVQILLSVVHFLKTQCQLSKPHALLYEELIKDDRLLPFLAFAIVSGEDPIVRVALALLQDKSGVRGFLEKLTTLVAKGGRLHRPMEHVEVFADDVGQPSFSHLGEGRRPNTPDFNELDAVLSKLRSTQIVDKSVSGIIEIYEAKIAASQLQLDHLKEQLRLRIEAVQKSDKLFANFLMQNQNAKKEEERLRAVLRETAKSRETLAKELEESNALVATLTKRLASVETALQREREQHAALRDTHDKLKSSFESMSKKVLQLDDGNHEAERRQKTAEVEGTQRRPNA